MKKKSMFYEKIFDLMWTKWSRGTEHFDHTFTL